MISHHENSSQECNLLRLFIITSSPGRCRLMRRHRCGPDRIPAVTKKALRFVKGKYITCIFFIKPCKKHLTTNTPDLTEL